MKYKLQTQLICGIVENIVANTLTRLPFTLVDKYEPITMKYQCRADKLFTTGMFDNNKYSFPLDILDVQI